MQPPREKVLHSASFSVHSAFSVLPLGVLRKISELFQKGPGVVTVAPSANQSHGGLVMICCKDIVVIETKQTLSMGTLF